MLKQWFISEYWGAQGIYENFRTKQSGRGYYPSLLIIYIMLNGHYDIPYPILSFASNGAKIYIFNLLIVY